MRVEDLLTQFLAQVHLRLVVVRVRLVLDDVEAEMVEGAVRVDEPADVERAAS